MDVPVTCHCASTEFPTLSKIILESQLKELKLGIAANVEGAPTRGFMLRLTRVLFAMASILGFAVESNVTSSFLIVTSKM